MKLINFIKLKFGKQPAQPGSSMELMKSSIIRKAPSPEKISYIHYGTSIKGSFKSQDNIYFNGTIDGDIKLNKKLVLGEKSEVKGNVNASDLLVLGKVEGDMYIQNRVTFGNSSSFTGKISAKAIKVKVGTIFNADCMVRETNEGLEEATEQLPVVVTSESDEAAGSSSSSDNEENAFFLSIFQNQ